ncbi:MAG TPA: ABC transporter permease subunit [Candidatus Lokiarchaeia archaeon]|nr:ABC transporter permease subunit [Candidatus Lokiarchaeia archaeon]
MDLSKAWVIARKDFSIFRKKKLILYLLFILPSIIGIALPLLMLYVIPQVVSQQASDIASLTPALLASDKILLQGILQAFVFLFVVIAAIIPIYLSSYSIVGEKVEKTLEPLLATPTTDGELLLGKILACVIPSLAAAYAGTVIFIILTDTLLPTALFPQPFLPDDAMWTMLWAVIPTASMLSVEAGIIISSRITDVRAATQSGGLIIAPYLVIYVIMEISGRTVNGFHYSSLNLFIIGSVSLLADICLAFAVRSLFGRESILTKWK